MAGVTRVGDKSSGHLPFTGSGEPIPLDNGSPTVFVNGKAAGRVGDTYKKHGSGTKHKGVIITGSSNLFADGKDVARLGDKISCGLQFVAEASSDTYN